MNKQKVVLFLYSTPNLVGSALGLVGLSLLFTGIIHDYGVAIVAALYVIGVLVTPTNEKYQLKIKSSLETNSLKDTIKELVASVKGRLSEPVINVLDDLHTLVGDILPRMDNHDALSHERHVVKQIVTNWLPDLLETYLRLPPAYARMHVMKCGKTPREELITQIELLQSQLGKVLEGLIAEDTEELLVHGRFLEKKFGQKYDWLT